MLEHGKNLLRFVVCLEISDREIPKFLPLISVFDFRIDDFRSSPEEGDQAAGAGVASLAGPS